MAWVFGDCQLDESVYQLRRRERPVKIEPKVFDVLLYLLRNAERVVSKRELLDALWPGEAVSDSVLPRCIAAARQAVGDTRNRQRVIQTVHGRGYRFVADARETRPAPAAAPARASEPDEGGERFVGRREVMAALRAGLEHAFAGRGRVTLLAGEPGIGKTRTAEELGGEARRRGARWLVGRCAEHEGAPAFWPWVQILRAGLAAADADADADAVDGSAQLAADLGPGAVDVAELLPELRGRFPELGEPQGLEGEQARFRLFESVAGFLCRAARRTPLVLCVDDLHWADADSLGLFHFLVTQQREARLYLIGTYRDAEVRRPHPLRQLLGELARQDHCERLALRGLEPGEVAALVDAVGGVAAKPELVTAVADMTEGNPFFVREVVRLLAAEGRLEDAPVAAPLALPQGVRDAIGRRLDALSDECNEVLRCAAVLGRDFGLPLLERVTDASGEELLELLGEALAAGVIAEAADGMARFSFDHALLRQTLDDELSVSQRVALHRRAGEALEAIWVDPAERPDAPFAELAHHFRAAAPSGTVERAVRYGVRAAERAHELCAYAESARHYERALEVQEFDAGRDPERRCELLIGLGEELWTSGQRERGREKLAEAAVLARRLASRPLFARAAIAYRGFGEMGMPPDPMTLALLEEARDGLGDGYPALRARILAQLTGTPPYALSMEMREQLSREAAALAARSGDSHALRAAVGARYWATLGPDRIEERLAVAREAHALAARSNDRQLSIVAHEAELGAHLLLGDVEAADRDTEAYERLADELRQPVFRFLASAVRASQALNCGEFAEAERRMRETLERGRDSVPYAEVLFAGQTFWLLFQRGEVAGVAANLVESTALFRERFSGMEGFIRILSLVGRVAGGRLAAARREFDVLAARDFADLERDEHWMIQMSLLAFLVFELRDRERAAVLYDLLLPYAELAISHDLLRAVAGSAQSVLGLLAALLDRGEVAIAHLERGLERETAMGLRPALLRTRIFLAASLRARGSAGDARRASALEREAKREAAALGCRPLVGSRLISL